MLTETATTRAKALATATVRRAVGALMVRVFTVESEAAKTKMSVEMKELQRRGE